MSEHRFDGKVALVTGRASGIGEAVSRLMLSGGARVVIVDRQEDRGRSVAAELGDRSMFAADVAEEADVAAAIAAAVATFGRLDIVCNNAGVAGPDPSILDVDVAQFQYVIGVLLLGTKHGAPAMVAGGHGGAVVNTASVAALRSGEGPLPLHSSQARHRRTHPLRERARGIRDPSQRHDTRRGPHPLAASFRYGDSSSVTDVAKSIAERSPLRGRGSSPEDIAEAIAWLPSDASGYLTGEVLVVDAGKTLSPSRVPVGSTDVRP